MLNHFSYIEHMEDFVVYSHTQSPIFILLPKYTEVTKVGKIFERFKECLLDGELTQAMTILD